MVPRCQKPEYSGANLDLTFELVSWMFSAITVNHCQWFSIIVTDHDTVMLNHMIAESLGHIEIIGWVHSVMK